MFKRSHLRYCKICLFHPIYPSTPHCWGWGPLTPNLFTSWCHKLIPEALGFSAFDVALILKCSDDIAVSMRGSPCQRHTISMSRPMLHMPHTSTPQAILLMWYRCYQLQFTYVLCVVQFVAISLVLWMQEHGGTQRLVSSQLGCEDTSQIWTWSYWYSIHVATIIQIDNSKNWKTNGTICNWLNPHAPGKHHYYMKNPPLITKRWCDLFI